MVPMRTVTLTLTLLATVLLPSTALAQNSTSFPLQMYRAASVVALETGVPAFYVYSEWMEAPQANQVAVVAAVEQLGADYVYAARDPEVGFDCSGLIDYAWKEAGVDLPRTSRAQIRAVDTSVDDIEVGDLMYYPGHIMMYLGFGDFVIHAANRQLDVVISEVQRSTTTGAVMVPKPSVGTARAF